MNNYLDANATGLAQMLWIFGGLTVLFLIAGVFQLCFWLARRIDGAKPDRLGVERFRRISRGRARQAAARDAVADQEWREEIAQTRNKPRATIVRDEALVEIARKAPTSIEALRGLRAVHSRDLDRHAGDVVARIAAALETPKDTWPQPPPPPAATPSTGVVELLQAVLRLRAEETGIAPSLLATNADLQLLVQRHAAGAAAELPIMQGWRHTIAGGALMALLEGRASVSLDPASGAVRVTKRRAGES